MNVRARRRRPGKAAGIDWDDVRVFLVIARAGQILAASRKLGIDHTTVSRHLSALEERLGTRLVERRTSGCNLTSAGERLKIVAERVESELIHAQSELTHSGLSLSGTVTLSLPECFSNFFFTMRLGKLLERYPELTVRLVLMPEVVSLSNRDADIAVTFAPPLEGRLAARKLTDFATGAFASRAFVTQNGPLDEQRTISDKTLIVATKTGMALADGAQFDNSPARTLECGSIVGQLQAIQAGVGFGMLPLFVAVQYPDLVPILPSLAGRESFWIVTHLDVRDIRRVKEVHRFLVSTVRSNAGLFAA